MASLFLLLGCNLSNIVDLFAALHQLASASARSLKLASSVRARLKPYGDTLNSLVYHRNIFGLPRKSSEIFGNLRKFWKMLGNVRLVFGTILENLENLENLRKIIKRRYQYVYIIKRTLHVSSKI